MKELSLHILDIAMNSIRANAKNVSIMIKETESTLELMILDDGCGMTEAETEKLSNPFYTTRITRKVGLGIPFLKLAAEQTDGFVTIKSKSEKQCKDHGTCVTARFYKKHIDYTPLGDIVETVVTLIQGNPEIDFVFRHKTEKLDITFDTRKLREILGDDIPLSRFEVLEWIKGNLKEQYEHN